MRTMQNKLKRYGNCFLPYLIILGMAFLIMLPQIHSHIFISGIDYYFHMARTYEAAMQIKTGHFSYFLSLFSWQHNARIVNAVYGPIGGYISGLILLLAKSWYRWGLIVSFLALFIAGSTMYCLGRYWHVRPTINLLISALYMLSTPLNDFVYGRTFAGFGAILVPLVFLIISEILTNKDVNPIKLALILVIIIEVHLMTFLISIVAIGSCILLALGLAHQNRKSLFIHVCESAVLMIALSFNVWGSILEVLGSNLHHIVSTFYNPVMGTQHTNTIMGMLPNTPWIQLPTLIGIMVFILLIITVIIWLIDLKGTNRVISVLMIIGLICFWLSSEWFPWRLLSHHFMIIGRTIQFPKRFLPFSLVPLYLCSGYLLSKSIKSKKNYQYMLYPILIFLCIVVGSNALSNYKMLQRTDNYYHSQVISWNNVHFMGKYNNYLLKQSLHSDQPGNFVKMVEKPVSDYMPSSNVKIKNPYGMYRQIYQKPQSFKWSLANHHGELIKWNSRRDVMHTIPFTKYTHTHVTLNGHNVKLKPNQIGAMRLPLKKGNNQIYIHYVPSNWYVIGIWISLLTWVCLICLLCYRKCKNLRNLL